MTPPNPRLACRGSALRSARTSWSRKCAGLLILFGCLSADGRVKRTSRWLTIPVQVNRETGMFLVDTGADHSVIDTEFAMRLGLSQAGIASVRTNSSSDTKPTVVAEEVRFGDRRISNLTLVAMDLKTAFSGLPVAIAGVLGSDMMETTSLTLGYASGTAQLGTAVDRVGFAVGLRRAKEGYLVPVTIGTSRLELLLDTGSTMTAISYAAWRSLPIADRRGAVVRGIRSSSLPDALLGCVPALTIGGAAIRNLPLRVVPPTKEGHYSDEGFAGALGVDVLEHFRVTLDLGHSTMYMDPDPAYRLDPYEFVTIGIQFHRIQPDAFSVSAVWKGTPADEAHLAVGDSIVSVNGFRSRDLDIDGFSEQLHGPAGAPVTLEVRRREGISVVRTRTRRVACDSDQSSDVVGEQR